MRELPQSEAGELPEAEAIQLAREGDAAAFERLYRLHSRRVFALCVRMLENLAEAEDLTQETFLTVFRRIHTFRGESGFSTWLHRVTVNVVLMHIRKEKVAQTSLEEITERTEETGAPRLELGGPDLYLNGTIDRLALQRAIDQLPPGFKAHFVLYDIEGYEHREIADMRGCSTGTSKSQLYRTRQRLRELLQKDQNNGTPGKTHSANRFTFEAVPPAIESILRSAAGRLFRSSASVSRSNGGSQFHEAGVRNRQRQRSNEPDCQSQFESRTI